jgi:hypothetical protein
MALDATLGQDHSRNREIEQQACRKEAQKLP